MNIRVLSLSLALLTFAMACSTTSFNPMPNEMNRALQEITGQDGRACVRVRDIAGFGALNDSTISVSDKFRGHYLMVTMHRCPNLEAAPAAAFAGAFTEFCGRRDSVYTRGGGRCPVQGVFEFENRDAAFAAIDRAEAMIRAQQKARED